ncbi:hypothetical protein AB0K09_27555 [Streptomyces sp. NPDC049577]|uniref:hypothetical protein n=1 Tax=Streptomyces sp. NPDC049577 TaxID=3155153 RepID=UPI00342AD437
MTTHDAAAGPPMGACYDPMIPDEIAQGDDTPYRPLIAGARIMTHGSSQPGTIGCFLVDETVSPKQYYVLTNNHVCAPSDVGLAVPGVTRMGSPSGGKGSSGCCSDIIGTFAAGRGGPPWSNPNGQEDTDRDEAVVRLAPGIKFRPAVLGLGPNATPGMITGTEPVTRAQATAGNYPVRKWGQRSGLTGGVLIGMEKNSANVDNRLIVRGNPNPECPNATFILEGDSGAVLVNNAGHIIGLLSHFEANTRNAKAYLIDNVLQRLKAEHNLTLKLVVSNGNPNEVITVPGAAHAAVPHEFAGELGEPGGAPGEPVYLPVGVPWPAGAEPAAAGAVTGIRTDLERTEAGRLLLRLWQRHQRELIDLVNTDRAIKVSWYRNGGAALVQLLLRMRDRPESRLPGTVHGVPLDLCLERLLALFARAGGDRLREDLAAARAALPDPADLPGMTYGQLIDALGTKTTPGERT